MTEHEAFAKLTAALTEASSSARMIGSLRSDQRDGWDKIAQLIDAAKDQCYEFAMRRMN